MTEEVEYRVLRRNGVVTCQVDRSDTKNLKHTNHHSPDGYEMGYGGSGPSDLALSILCDYFGCSPDFESESWSDDQKMAFEYHHAFKRKYIEPHHNCVRINNKEIDAFIMEEDKLASRKRVRGTISSK